MVMNHLKKMCLSGVVNFKTRVVTVTYTHTHILYDALIKLSSLGSNKKKNL